MPDRFDTIVVGAGPGGSSAALYLARRGYDVLMLEKAKVPGHRNVTGGILFGRYLDHYGLADLLPEFEEEAPIERKITDHSVYILSNPTGKKGSNSYKLGKITKDSFLSKIGLIKTDLSTGSDYSVLRVRFDRWLASKATEAGVMVATETSVEDLIFEDKKVIGVRTTDEELYSDLVIDASGVTSTLVERVGLRGKLRPDDIYHGVKHVYSLDEKTIEERFGVSEGEGKSIVALGEFMQGVSGGAFLYTNKTTISVGIVSPLESILRQTSEHPEKLGKPLELVENFETHPMIAGLLEGATLEEYSAHNIPKGHKAMLSHPYHDGFLAVGDCLGAFVKIGPMIDGIRRAVATGIMAAETYVMAKKSEDFSSKILSNYKRLLSPIYEDIRVSGRDSRISESGLTYGLLPKIMFTFGIMVEKIRQEKEPKTMDYRDAIQRIQERTGLLDYEEDKEYSHIEVNYEVCAESSDKSWVPACPFNCFTLVSDKGVFASFKDLYKYNLDLLHKQSAKSKGRESEARTNTLQDIRNGQVRFDHVACVGCGTCGVIGPSEAVRFGHERFGHGVKYEYG